MSVRVFAPAKINLTLKVGRARADGFHPLQSVVTFADVGDVIEVEPAPEIELARITGRFAAGLSGEGDNLVLRAARALAAEAGVQTGAAISLEKNLPIASGIGGGSSDAAATLKALNALWRLDMSEAELARIGARVGADVPVCVGGRPAWMTGVGELVAPLALPALDAVLVNPLQGLATGAVFAAFDGLGATAALADSPPPAWRTRAEAIAGAAAIGNDLAAPARALMPHISDIERSLQADARALHVAVSGSGATVFALVESRATAAALAGAIVATHPEWWVAAATLAGDA